MAPMKTRPITPPQSGANCWMAVETEASGREEAVTRSLSARAGLRFSNGQPHVDAQAPELRVLEAQLAAVQRDLLGDDRQAEPGARRGRVGAAGEGLDEAPALVRGGAGAGVRDQEGERSVVAPQADAHVAARPAVERRVVQQVVDEQPQPAAPAVD